MFWVLIPMDFPQILLIGSPGFIPPFPESCVSISIPFLLPELSRAVKDLRCYPECKVEVSPLNLMNAVRRHDPPRTKTKESITSVVVEYQVLIAPVL